MMGRNCFLDTLKKTLALNLDTGSLIYHHGKNLAFITLDLLMDNRSLLNTVNIRMEVFLDKLPHLLFGNKLMVYRK
jgi:hypothetical protein